MTKDSDSLTAIHRPRQNSANNNRLVVFFPSFIWTYDLHGSDASHQLLQQSDIAVGKLADALSDELLLVHGEAIGLPTLQQAAGHKNREIRRVLVAHNCQILEDFDGILKRLISDNLSHLKTSGLLFVSNPLSF